MWRPWPCATAMWFGVEGEGLFWLRWKSALACKEDRQVRRNSVHCRFSMRGSDPDLDPNDRITSLVVPRHRFGISARYSWSLCCRMTDWHRGASTA